LEAGEAFTKAESKLEEQAEKMQRDANPAR
jgi:hypothetical protein